MASLPTLLRTLGTRGAVSNARAALVHRQREDWLVASLARRLDVREQAVAARRRSGAGDRATGAA
jgi:hypothetical protein